MASNTIHLLKTIPLRDISIWVSYGTSSVTQLKPPSASWPALFTLCLLAPASQIFPHLSKWHFVLPLAQATMSSLMLLLFSHFTFNVLPRKWPFLAILLLPAWSPKASSCLWMRALASKRCPASILVPYSLFSAQQPEPSKYSRSPLLLCSNPAMAQGQVGLLYLSDLSSYSFLFYSLCISCTNPIAFS